MAENKDQSPIEGITSAATAAGAAAKKAVESFEQSNDLAKELVSQFVRISDLQKKGTESMITMNDFSKKILSNTAARKMILDQIHASIAKGEEAVIAARSKELEMQENLNSLQKDGFTELRRKLKMENSREQLDLSKKLLDIEDQMNDAQLKSIHYGEDLSDEYDSMVKDRATILEAQKKNELDSLSVAVRAAKIHSEAMESLTGQLWYANEITKAKEKELAEQQQLAKSVRLQAGYLAHMKDFAGGAAGEFGKLATRTGDFLKMIKETPMEFLMMDLALAGVAGLIELGWKRFVALDKAAESFRKETGFTNTQMVELRKNAESINREFQDAGVGIEQAYASAKALTDIFGRTSLVTKDAMTNVALMSANLGVSEEDSANVLATFEGLGGLSQKVAMNIMKAGAGISEKAGVPFKLVMNDIANASAETVTMLGANPTLLMKSAIAARAMGTDLNKLVGSQRKLLDYGSSINDELEASAMLGESITFQKARQLAYDGDIAASAQATLDTVKQAGDFNKMSVYQREALAKASGMDVQQLTKMLAVDRQRMEIMNGSDEVAKAKLKTQDDELKKMKAMSDLNDGDLVAQGQQQINQQKMQGLMTKFNNLMQSVILSTADVLEPIITPLVTILLPMFRVLALLIKAALFPLKLMLYPIQLIADGIGFVVDKVNDWIEGTKFLGDKTKGFFDFFESKLGIAVKALPGAAAGLLALKFFGKGGVSSLVSMIKTPFKVVGDLAKTAMSKIPGVGKMFSSKIPGVGKMFSSKIPEAGKMFSSKTAATSSDEIVGAADKSKAVKGNAGSGVKDFLTNLASGLKAMAGKEVLFGALNLIPASLGLVAMIPGTLGAFLVSKINGKGLKDGLSGLASGLKSMAGGNVLSGAINLIPASLGLIAMIPGTLGAFLVSKINGKGLKDGLSGLASGLKAMADKEVLFGALNLIPTSLGLIAMIPGAIGAFLVSKISGLKDGLSGLASGLKSMAGGNVLSGAINLIPASLGLIAMIPGTLGAFLVSKINGKGLKDGLSGLASGLKAMADKEVLFGALNLIPTSLGLIAMIPGTLGAFLVSKINGSGLKDGLSGLASGLEAMAGGKVAIGSLVMGLAALGLVAMIPGAIGMGLIALLGIPFSLGIRAVAAGISALANPTVGLGTLILAGISLALIGFGYAAKLASDSFVSIAKVIPSAIGPLIEFALIAPMLLIGAAAIGELSLALGLFAGASVVGKLTSFFTGDPFKKFEKLADMSERLKMTADAMMEIATAGTMFSAVNNFADAIIRLADSVGKLNDQLGATNVDNLHKLSTISSATAPSSSPGAAAPTTTTKLDTSALEGKLDKLTDLLVGGSIRVYMDGKNVSSVIAANSGR